MLAVCKLALYDTCSSDIVKGTRACACLFLKEITEYADTFITAQIDLSLSVGLEVASIFKL